MKRTVSFIILIALIVNCTYTLPQYKYDEHERKNKIIISERVGETIDTGERERFGLFTEISGFKEARFFAINGGYVVEIATDDEKLVAINRDQDAVMILHDYVNKYEEISTDRAAFESKWNILDYDTLGIPITENEVRRTIKQSRGRAVKHGLTCCGVSALGGLLLGIPLASSDGSGTDIAPAIAAAAGAVVLATGVVIGLITGSIIYFTTGKNADSVLKAIKEARMPRMVE